MAKYEVTYKCGHTGTVVLFGKESERKRKIAWYEENCICPECYEAEQAAKHEAQAQKYALPELVGTEKQVSWAEKIRSKFIEIRNSMTVSDSNKTAFENFCNEFFSETSASAWIKRKTSGRYDSPTVNFKMAFKSYRENN